MKMKTEKDSLLEDVLDIRGAEYVEVLVKEDGKVLWVNIEGLCVLRICRIDILTIEDKRKKVNHRL